MPTEKKHKFSDYFYNRITYGGVALALLVFIIECLLFGIDFFTNGANFYLGILTYVFLPPFLILGLILIPLGAAWKHKRILKGISESAPKTLFIDPAIPTHRNAIFVFLIGTSILMVMTIIGSYKAFHYTESVHFCGVTCHDVMKPEYATYLNSPHARVKCVECHIGPGANWYVKSKLSGLRQVYHTIKNDYAKPIPTPVQNLRPSAETCEQCHWPGKFYSSVELRRTYRSTEADQPDPWSLRMLIHVGRDEKKDYGIHSHMYVDQDVYYVADDQKRQVISWVKTIGKDGKEEIFTTPDSPYKDKEPPQSLVRKMDCMDCHNRPSHRFEPPFDLINRAMNDGKINPQIPSIKSKAMEVLSKPYKTEQEALQAIPKTILEYYQNKHPEFYQSHQEDIKKSADEIVILFKNNIFPERKARWDIYPDNIGHLVSPGCFRCHDDQHAAASGKTITKNCNSCHSIIEQGTASSIEKSTDGLTFRHPFNEDESWKEMNCTDCHTGN
ncbi:MAG: NapC/NirT family cytochrome c [Candidatus Omnitrophota bacterium]